MVGAYSLKYINLFLLTSTIVSSEAREASIDKAFQKGIEAYNGERWSECIKQFENSLHLHKLYKSIVSNCRLDCNSKQYETQIKENMEDLKFYERKFIIKNCLNECQEFAFKDLSLLKDVSDFTLHNMQARKPYEYLHMCYFQMNMLPKAASASYTYLVANPQDDIMNHNFLYYKNQPEVDVKEIVDFLSEDYKLFYDLGTAAYKKENWGETIANMEGVITDFLSSENICRVECESQPEQEWSTEFTVTLSNNIASLLHCCQQCQDKVKYLGYGSGPEFLADVLNYLQISYYHQDKVKEAAKAVASYLIIFPTDTVMLKNKEIYSSVVPQEAFTERPDIVFYYKRDVYEKKLLTLFHRDQNNTEFNAI